MHVKNEFGFILRSSARVPYSSFQTSFVEAVQRWSPPGGEALARLFSALGGEYFYLLAIPCLLWFAPWQQAVRVARATIWVDLLGEAIKWSLKWPRPDASLALAQESSPGFVSTHAAISLAVALLLGLERPKWRPWLLLWVLGVSWSRLRLGVHFPLDILGGWLLGLLVALLLAYQSRDTRKSIYIFVASGLCLSWWWPLEGTESLQRNLGLLLGLEGSLWHRLGGADKKEPPATLSFREGFLRLTLLLIIYVGAKGLELPRLLRYSLLAIVAAWRQPSAACNTFFRDDANFSK